MATLPYIRAVYNGIYKRYAAPKAAAWAREVLPRAEENRDNGQAEEPQPVAGGEEIGGMNFELGVELEIIEEEEVVPGDRQRDRQPGDAIAVPENQDAAPPPPDIQGRRMNADGNRPQAQAQNQNQNQNQDNANGPGQGHHRHREFNFSIGELTQTIIGALVFPSIAATMGGLLKAALPKSWTMPPNFWDRRNGGFLQSRFGRSIAGGCLFIVLKDSLLLYVKYRTAQDHRKRRILDYDKKKARAVQR